MRRARSGAAARRLRVTGGAPVPPSFVPLEGPTPTRRRTGGCACHRRHGRARRRRPTTRCGGMPRCLAPLRRAVSASVGGRQGRVWPLESGVAAANRGEVVGGACVDAERPRRGASTLVMGKWRRGGGAREGGRSAPRRVPWCPRGSFFPPVSRFPAPARPCARSHGVGGWRPHPHRTPTHPGCCSVVARLLWALLSPPPERPARRGSWSPFALVVRPAPPQAHKAKPLNMGGGTRPPLHLEAVRHPSMLANLAWRPPGGEQNPRAVVAARLQQLPCLP
jgi:hypothetical protein